MDIIGIAGFIFAAAAGAALVHEHRTDVLHGPYIEGRARSRRPGAIWEPVRALADELSFRARNAVYLASLA